MTQLGSIDPSGPGAAEVEGQLLEADGKAAEAQAAYEKAVSANSGEPRPRRDGRLGEEVALTSSA